MVVLCMAAWCVCTHHGICHASHVRYSSAVYTNICHVGIELQGIIENALGLSLEKIRTTIGY